VFRQYQRRLSAMRETILSSSVKIREILSLKRKMTEARQT